ncbi:uncharacterized protein LOC144119125 [Amblyomma americanum]
MQTRVSGHVACSGTLELVLLGYYRAKRERRHRTTPAFLCGSGKQASVHSRALPSKLMMKIWVFCLIGAFSFISASAAHTADWLEDREGTVFGALGSFVTNLSKTVLNAAQNIVDLIVPEKLQSPTQEAPEAAP